MNRKANTEADIENTKVINNYRKLHIETFKDYYQEKHKKNKFSIILYYQNGSWDRQQRMQCMTTFVLDTIKIYTHNNI